MGAVNPVAVAFTRFDVIAYEVKAGVGPGDLRATLKPGKTVRSPGRPGGTGDRRCGDPQPATDRSSTSPWQGHGFIRAYMTAGSRLHGFDPRNATPVYFLDADHQWGVAIELPGKQAIEDLTVRLQPNAAKAKVRFVSPDA